MTAANASWAHARLALALLALDPDGLGGAVIRMRACPRRDTVLNWAKAVPLPTRKIHPDISDGQLYGGIDISATLAAGQVVHFDGILATQKALILTMAERCPASLAAKLALALDSGAGHALIALDEGADADEACPPALLDRVAFHITPAGRLPDTLTPVPAGTLVRTADVDLPEDALAALTTLAAALGIESLRAPQFAARAARAHAALQGRSVAQQEDFEVATALVLAPRAKRMPETEMENTSPAPPEPETRKDETATDGATLPGGDMLVEALKASLPADLLAHLVPTGAVRQAKGVGAGQSRKSNRRGRPLPSKRGKLDGTRRIDLVATLRAAAPWQPLRAQQRPDHSGLHIRPDDIRVKQYQERSDRLLIFVVDASGSAAVSRLGEAKGAIELLLGDAYATRDHVALIAFRGTEAEVLLPPNKSLVQTKKRLAALPGGGGTPLASGLAAAVQMIGQGKAKGLTPSVVLITDGRANVALDGRPDRGQAAEDASTWAKAIAATGAPGVVIDMSKRPQDALSTLATQMQARYLALPRADAHRLSDAVTDMLTQA